MFFLGNMHVVKYMLFSLHCDLYLGVINKATIIQKFFLRFLHIRAIFYFLEKIRARWKLEALQLVSMPVTKVTKVYVFTRYQLREDDLREHIPVPYFKFRATL